MRAVLLGMMGFVFLTVMGCGGHVLHKHDGERREQQPAARTQAEPFHRHNAAVDTRDGRDRGNHDQVISEGQLPGGGAEGTPGDCSGGPDGSAEDDACSAPEGKNSFFP